MPQAYIKDHSDHRELTITLDELRMADDNPARYYPVQNARAKIRITTNIKNEWGDCGWQHILKLGDSVTVVIED